MIHCIIGKDCKVAVDKLRGANGLVRAPGTETFYVASALGRELRVLERQADDTLVVTDVINVGMCRSGKQ